MVNKPTAILSTVLVVILGIVLTFSIIGGTADTIQDSAVVVDINPNCTSSEDSLGVDYEYNRTDGWCYNSTGVGGAVDITRRVHPAGEGDTLPLNALFGTSGLLLIVLMAGLILFSIRVAMMMKKR